MAENQDIVFSAKATDVATKFVETGYFKARSEVALFAAAYIIRTQFKTFDPSTFVSDSNGSNYGYGTFDPDGKWSRLLTAMYGTDKPRLFLKNLMIYGLETIGDNIEKAGGIIQITDYIA